MTHFGGTIMIGCCVPFSLFEGEVDANVVVVACKIISEAEWEEEERWRNRAAAANEAMDMVAEDVLGGVIEGGCCRLFGVGCYVAMLVARTKDDYGGFFGHALLV